MRVLIMSKWGLGLGLVTLALGAGCKDQAKCDEAVQTTRQAIGLEDMAVARQWREYTWRTCQDAALLATLDQEIIAKEKEIAARVEAKAKAARDLAQERLKDAQKLWIAFDQKKDDERTSSELKRVNSRAKRLSRGVDPAFVEQIDEFNRDEFERREKELEKKK